MISKTKRFTALMLMCFILVCALASCGRKQDETIAYWNSDSPAMASIISYVSAVTDEKSEDFVPEDRRIAVFDVDGTLYGELYPTYFDESLLLHRLLHDENYQPSEEDRAYAEEAEKALLNGQPEPDSPRSSAQMAAEAFRGFTVEEYRAYVREFMGEPVAGFDNMTYGEGFYLPMVELVRYLSEHGFTIFICTGTERSLERELIEDALGEAIQRAASIPMDRMIKCCWKAIFSRRIRK